MIKIGCALGESLEKEAVEGQQVVHDVPRLPAHDIEHVVRIGDAAVRALVPGPGGDLHPGRETGQGGVGDTKNCKKKDTTDISHIIGIPRFQKHTTGERGDWQ